MVQFRVGVVVIATILIGATLAVWFGDPVGASYTIYLKFPRAPGVGVDTPVRKNGVRIGRVAQLELADDGVLLTLEIDKRRRLRTSETARISTASLLGGSVVEFVPGEPGGEDRPIRDGEMLAGGAVSQGPTEIFQLMARMEGRIDAALASVENAGQQVAQLSTSLNEVVRGNEQQLRALLEQSNQALGRFSVAMDHVNSVMGDEQLRGRLRQTLEQLPEVVVEARQTLNDARQTLASIDQASRLAQQNLQNLEGLTEPLGQQGQQLAAQIQQSVRNINELTEQLVYFSRALNSQQGSLGQLIHDPQLYDRLLRAADNIELVSRRLVPVMHDARILADKLARDPSQLGVRGALARRPPGGGLKHPYFGLELPK